MSSRFRDSSMLSGKNGGLYGGGFGASFFYATRQSGTGISPFAESVSGKSETSELKERRRTRFGIRRGARMTMRIFFPNKEEKSLVFSSGRIILLSPT